MEVISNEWQVQSKAAISTQYHKFGRLDHLGRLGEYPFIVVPLETASPSTP
jgi:hypothetical protein